MISFNDIKILSLDFRRISSNLLNSNFDNADVNLKRFKKFIDDSQFISQVLLNTMHNIYYDFRECFTIKDSGWYSIEIPSDEKLHVKAQYDYLTYIIEDAKGGVLGQAQNFPHSGKTWADIIQSFMIKAFKPLIDYINDNITKEIMILEEKLEKVPAMFQNIERNYGSVVQGNTVTSNNITNVNDHGDLIELLNQALSSLVSIDVPEDIKEDVQDDFMQINEQITSTSPNKRRIKKALEGIKKFTSEFGMKLAVTMAATSITKFDWNILIEKIEAFLNNLPSA